MSTPALRRSLASVLPRFAVRRYASTTPDKATSRAPPRATPIPAATSPMSDVVNLLSQSSPRSLYSSTSPMGARSVVDETPVSVMPELDPSSSFDLQSLTTAPAADDEYHLHVYSTKHNTHITFTRPDKGAIVSLSAGNVGFKKSHRGTYDAAYQLAKHVFEAIEAKKVKPRAIEVVLRGFGQGREAVVKALLGQEGRFLRPVVKRVTDSTRLKFGGTRSPKPRRLG